jgi:hypothetical protein
LDEFQTFSPALRSTGIATLSVALYFSSIRLMFWSHAIGAVWQGRAPGWLTILFSGLAQ